MTKALRLKQPTIKIHFTVAMTFCLLEKGSFNPRYRLDLLIGPNDGKKSSNNSDRLTDNQRFKRETNPLDKNSESATYAVHSIIGQSNVLIHMKTKLNQRMSHKLHY